MALGAQVSSIVGLALRESLMLVGLGVIAGIGTVHLAERSVAALLYGVAPTDPGTIVRAAAVLIGVAAAAGCVPAGPHESTRSQRYGTSSRDACTR